MSTTWSLRQVPRSFVTSSSKCAALTGSVYGRRMYEVMRIRDEDLPEWGAEERDFDIPDLYKRLRLIGEIDTIIADAADLIAAHRLDFDTVRDVLALSRGRSAHKSRWVAINHHDGSWQQTVPSLCIAALLVSKPNGRGAQGPKGLKPPTPSTVRSFDRQGRGDHAKVFAAALCFGARRGEDCHTDRQHHRTL